MHLNLLPMGVNVPLFSQFFLLNLSGDSLTGIGRSNPSEDLTWVPEWFQVFIAIALAVTIWYLYRRWYVGAGNKNMTSANRGEAGANVSAPTGKSDREYIDSEKLEIKIAFVESQIDMLMQQLSAHKLDIAEPVSTTMLNQLHSKAAGLAGLIDQFLKDEPAVSPGEIIPEVKYVKTGNENVPEILRLISVETGKNLDAQSLGGKDHHFVSQCVNLILENISVENLNAGFFAKGLKISRSLVYIKIEAITGLTVNEFVRNVRLLRAKHLLEEDRLRITEIAYAVGFKSQSYFTQSFKKKYGQSPKEYVNLSRH